MMLLFKVAGVIAGVAVGLIGFLFARGRLRRIAPRLAPLPAHLSGLSHTFAIVESPDGSLPVQSERPLATASTRELADRALETMRRTHPDKRLGLALVQPCIRHRFLNWIGDPLPPLPPGADSEVA